MSTTSYYSVEQILTENEKATCTFDLDVPQLTVLNNGSKIDRGTKLELPLWIAEMLAVSRPRGEGSALAALEMPEALGLKVMNALRADPKSVALKQQSMYFYGVGERMLQLFDDDEVAEVLTDTFKQRALEIADKAQNFKGTRDEFIDSMEDHERKLFKAAHEGSRDVKRWFDANRV